MVVKVWGLDKTNRYKQIVDDVELHTAFEGIDQHIKDLAELKKR